MPRHRRPGAQAGDRPDEAAAAGRGGWNLAGLSPFFTPNADFYRVDTALVLPKVSAADWQLRIHGMVDRPVTLTYDDLIRQPMIDRDITLTCVSEAVGGNYIGNARWQGTLLAPICARWASRRAQTRS